MHKYTEEDDAYIRENRGKLSWAKIGRHIGVSGKAAKSRADRFGNVVSNHYTVAEDEYIIRNYANQSARIIGEKLGRSAQSVQKRVMFLRERRPELVYVLDSNRNAANWSQSRSRLHNDGYLDVPWWMRQSTRDQGLVINMYARE